MTTNTVEEWIRSLQSAMDENQEPDLGGLTAYDHFKDHLFEISARGEADNFLDAFIHIAISDPRHPARWWNRYFNILESFKQLDQSARLRLTEIFEDDFGSTPDIRALILRQLAALKCKLDWSSLSRQQSFQQAQRDFPLFIADAMVWSERYFEAVELLREALKIRRIELEDVERMQERWRERGVPAQEISLDVRLNELVDPLPRGWLGGPKYYRSVTAEVA